MIQCIAMMAGDGSDGEVNSNEKEDEDGDDFSPVICDGHSQRPSRCLCLCLSNGFLPVSCDGDHLRLPKDHVRGWCEVRSNHHLRKLIFFASILLLG